jgi:hypothetical protein
LWNKQASSSKPRSRELPLNQSTRAHISNVKLLLVPHCWINKQAGQPLPRLPKKTGRAGHPHHVTAARPRQRKPVPGRERHQAPRPRLRGAVPLPVLHAPHRLERIDRLDVVQARYVVRGLDPLPHLAQFPRRRLLLAAAAAASPLCTSSARDAGGDLLCVGRCTHFWSERGWRAVVLWESVGGGGGGWG